MAARDVASREQPPEQVAGCPHPRETEILLGHDKSAHLFQQAVQRNHVHHAWLLEGQKGIGKATFAWHAAKKLLGVPSAAHGAGALAFDAQSPLNRQIIAKGHPDVLQLSRSWDDKTKKWASVISVNQARSVGEFFSKKAGEASWRACVLDAVDEMNANAMNALLKTLEEPPAKGVLFLICHQPGKLPDTIRSRCRRLLLRAPEKQSGLRIVAQNAVGVSHKEQELALDLAAGSPGFALEILHLQGLEMWADIENLLDHSQHQETAVDRVMSHLAGKANPPKQALLFSLLLRAQEKMALKLASQGEVVEAAAWDKAHRQSKFLTAQLNSLNLDASACLLQVMSDIQIASMEHVGGGHS